MRYGWLVIPLALWAAPAASALEPTKERPIVVEDMTISAKEIRHWERVARRAGSGASRDVIVQMVVENRWLLGEARWRGLTPTRPEVLRAFRRQKRAAFPTGFRRWLRSTGQTRADILMRVRVDMISNRLRRFATAGSDDPQTQQELLDAFAEQFRDYWVPRTICSPRYFVEGVCGA